MLDLISIGDVTIDNFLKIHDAEISCTVDKTRCVLCVEYGSKIPVDEFIYSIGGNATHNTIGASRLKLKAAIYANIGDDFASNQIIKKLRQEGVSTKYTIVNEGMQSNVSTVITFKGERTIFSYHQGWNYKLPDFEQSKWVYFTSLAKTFPKSNLVNELCLYLERTGTKLLFNPGTHQIHHGVKKYPKLLSLTYIFIVNMEEAKKILGYDIEKNINIKIILQELADLGPKIVVVTDGGRGSFGFDGEHFYQSDVFPADVVEMTGAGDAYATGLLAGFFYGKDLKEAMRWGAANSASVIATVGPSEGLLTYYKMQEILKRNSKIEPREI